MLRTCCAAVLLLVAALVTGCTDGSDRPAADRSGGTTATAGASASAPASATATPPPPAPRRAACYALSPAELTRAANDSRPVPCSSRHTARTVLVGRLDDVVRGHAVAVDSATVQRQLARTCPRRLAAFVGGTVDSRRLSRFEVVWFSPTAAQSDEGAHWFRCDLVAFDRAGSLLALPTSGSLRGVLDRPGALGQFGLCGTASPGTSGFQRVICRRRHTWRAIDTVDLAGGTTYPGAAAVRSRGEGTCQDEARGRATDSLKFRYGWEWPTKEQWRAGQHYGFCWVPASS